MKKVLAKLEGANVFHSLTDERKMCNTLSYTGHEYNIRGVAISGDGLSFEPSAIKTPGS